MPPRFLAARNGPHASCAGNPQPFRDRAPGRALRAKGFHCLTVHVDGWTAKCTPRARANARPEKMHWRINSRSNSAMLAKMPKIRRPFVVVPPCANSQERPITSRSP
jgi:hypothetical protein